MTPTTDLMREWLHVGDGEEFSVEWEPGGATVRARGMKWHLEWNAENEIRLDGAYKDAWTWEYRRELKDMAESAKGAESSGTANKKKACKPCEAARRRREERRRMWNR